MPHYYKLSSNCRVKNVSNVPEFTKNTKELFNDFKSDCGHRHSVDFFSDAKDLIVEMSFSDEISYSTQSNLDDAWKKFCKENADFKDGAIECQSVDDDAANEEDREKIWYIGTEKNILEAEIKNVEEQLLTLGKHHFDLLEKVKKANADKIVANDEGDYAEVN